MAARRIILEDLTSLNFAKRVMELGKEDSLLAQNRLLTQQIEALTAQLKAVQVNSAPVNSLQSPPVPQPTFTNYDYGARTAGQGGVYNHYEDNAHVNYMGNVLTTVPFSQNGAFNSYQHHHRIHPNLSYQSDNYLNSPQAPYRSHPPPIPHQNQPPSYNQPSYNNQKNYYQPSNQFHNPHTNQQPPFHYQNHTQNNQTNTNTSNLESTLLSFMKETHSLFKNQDATIRNLENQIGQLSKQISERPPGSFPADTTLNANEDCQVIVTSSGSVLGENNEAVAVEEILEKNTEKEDDTQQPNTKTTNDEGSLPQQLKWEKRKEEKNAELPLPSCKVPHPQRFKKKQEQFLKFSEILKTLKINIPFTNALKQMPTYVKFMKEILTNKRMLQNDDDIVAMDEEQNLDAFKGSDASS